jgi:Ribonuclease G/E
MRSLAGRGHDGNALLSAARAAFGPDNPGVAISPVSRFGTLELTIPRRRRPVVEVLRENPALTSALALIRALEREGRAQPGARLVAACAPTVAKAAGPCESQLADRLGRRFGIVAKEGWPLERMEVSAR